MAFERGTGIAVRYRDEILKPYVRLFTGAVGPGFILMAAKERHIELIWSMNLFVEWIPQFDLQTSSVYSKRSNPKAGYFGETS
ncbi:hypothetical protein TNCV_1145581 [Trichonephila clavipes]|nr:hypothetical protein TNCV_1145581 [Trichonephila clavipes]